MLVHVVAEAVLGRRTTIGAAWAATRGRMWRLVGLMLTTLVLALVLFAVPVVVGVAVGLRAGVGPGLLVGVPLLLAALVVFLFLQVRFFLLAAPALVLERTGVLASLRRAGRLSRGQFWRLFGTMLLAALLVGVVGQVVSVPLGIVGAVGPVLFPGTTGALMLVFSSFVTQVVVGALTTPFTSAVTALQYVDQRIRKEGLDVQLIAASQGRPLSPMPAPPRARPGRPAPGPRPGPVLGGARAVPRGVPPAAPRAVRVLAARPVGVADPERAGRLAAVHRRRRAGAGGRPRPGRGGRGPAAPRPVRPRRASPSVLGAADASPDEHRAAAEAALAAGRPDTALVEAFRALASRALGRGLVEPRPGLTAHELADDLSPASRRTRTTWPGRPCSSTWCSTASRPSTPTAPGPSSRSTRRSATRGPTCTRDRRRPSAPAGCAR